MSDIPDPLSAFKSGFDIGDVIHKRREAALLAAAKAEEERKAREARETIMARLQAPDAGYDDYMKVSMLMDPKEAEAVQNAAKALKVEEQQAALTDSSKLFAALRAGRVDVATSLLKGESEAQRKANNTQGADFADALIKLVETSDGVKAVENLIGYQMAVLPGGKAAFDAINQLEAERRSAELQPDVGRKTKAEADKLVEEAKQKAHRETEEIELIEAQTAEAWANAWRLQHPNQPGSNAPADKLINEAVDNVGEAAQLAARASNLAAAIEQFKPPVGVVGATWEFLKKAAGGEDAVTALKQEYKTLRNTEALKHLPPGAASDKDIEIALGAFPEENASPAFIAAFMRGVAKIQAYNVEYNKAKAQWVDKVGNLGSAKEDFTVGNISIKKGQNFWDLTNSIPMPNIVGKNKPVEVDF